MAGREAKGAHELDESKVRIAASTNAEALKPSIGLFLELLESDFHDILRLNEMTGRQEWYNPIDKEWVQWTDVNDSKTLLYFQKNYGLYSPKMLENAITIHFSNKKVNPLKELLESLRWDGKARVENFLHETIRCEDTPYSREVSRLIFAGGINRAYNPGCKFDDMVVLIGKQGGGKSALVRWLNIDDRYFREIKTISGKEGIEALRGVWIGEVAELMAMTRVKESEAVKAYITAQEDSYRAPYGKHVETIPRRCVFIGTTNNAQFLSDKTGNRRFYPIQCNENGYDLFDREAEVREYIKQCWAEALVRYNAKDMQPYAKRELLDAIRTEQSNAEEDDWRVGAIRAYIDAEKKAADSTVCVIELWHRALGEPAEKKPDRGDSIDISKIMNEIPGWERCKTPARLPGWGLQKVWRKKSAQFFPFWQ